MSVYTFVLFFHITGALGLFAALGLEWTGLWQLRSSTIPEQVRAWMGIFKNTRKVGFVSMVATVLTGIYMMLKAAGGAPWIIVTIGALILIIGLSLALTGPRMRALGRAMATGTRPGSPDFHRLASHPLLWISIQTRVVMVLGIIFLKLARPDWGGSLLTISAAIVLGLVSALPVLRQEQPHEKLAG